MSEDFSPIEVVEPETRLTRIVQESGLEKTKAQVLLDNFSNYFNLAAEWEIKAKSIVITDVSQKHEMKMAREGRLELKQKRIEVEKTRKILKEQSLREGKAIDGIANVLKAVIEPIEQYLEVQEKFAERKEAERKQALRNIRTGELSIYVSDLTVFSDLGEMTDGAYAKILQTAKLAWEENQKAVRKAEEERIAKEKAETEERERIRLENEKLKADAVERERLAKIEREKQEKLLAEAKARADLELQKAKDKQEKIFQEERARHAAAEREQRALAEKNRIEQEKRDAEARKAKAEAEEKLRQAKAEADRLQAELKVKQEKEAKELKAKQDAEKKAKSAPDKVKLKILADHLRNPKLPEMVSEEYKRMMTEVKERMLNIALDIDSFIDDQESN